MDDGFMSAEIGVSWDSQWQGTPEFRAFCYQWEREKCPVDDGGWPTRGETVAECG